MPKQKSYTELIPIILAFAALIQPAIVWADAAPTYPIVDTGQNQCIGLSRTLSTCPQKGDATYGQDAQYQGSPASYRDNNDGTVTDMVTGLMWSQTTDTNGDGEINVQDKMTLAQAKAYVQDLKLAGHADWRLPSIKTLYSLMLFDGEDVSINMQRGGRASAIPFIDHETFGFAPGDMSAGERLIDSQYVSSTEYVTTTMRGDPTVFGVNFIDGRIKGYGFHTPHGEKKFYVMAVRGNPAYGQNKFYETGHGTIHDKATGLIWQQSDSRNLMNFEKALKYCEALTLAGKSDWRLPNAKELQSIVDYSRAPATTGTAAIDPLFSATKIRNEAGFGDFANYWSSTTHKSASGRNGSAAYVAFGSSMGNMRGTWMDVHGAGAQRSDPKTGDPSRYSNGRGPQGDSVRINNMVRCVRGGDVKFVQTPQAIQRASYSVSLPENSDTMQPGNRRRGQMGGHMGGQMGPPPFERRREQNWQ